MTRNKVFGIGLATLGLSLLVAVGTMPSIAAAQNNTIDFGGEKFGGEGDKKKPRCQVSHPVSATETFFIAWNCVDDTADRDDIVTEMWILRPNATRFDKVEDFIGFPASLEVNEHTLQNTHEDGLPATFRLAAVDTAGNRTVSPPFTITGRDNDLDQCTLVIETRATEADGSTTGLPVMSVRLDSVPVFAQSSSNSSFTLSMFSERTAVPCEIDELCSEDNENEVDFVAAITVDEMGDATARINVDPGELEVNAEGSGTVTDNTLDAVDVTGTTTIDGVVADVTLICSQS